MRLWSIHPRYLDKKGLVAVWREGLLAKKVLEGKTIGYKNHPQLIRFKNLKKPIEAINSYLYYIHSEGRKRGYKFNINKIEQVEKKGIIKVTRGQVIFEFSHLLKKLRKRDRKKYDEIKAVKNIEANPVFRVIEGGVENWEKRKSVHF
ncbi:MAG: pyrimidine dimer DNA glycosylase/endonuclease V [Candidatus Anstonellales archaeon]